MEDTQIEQCSGPLEFGMPSQRSPIDVQPPTPLSVPPLLVLGLLLLGLCLPVLAIDRWKNWDTFGWTLRVLQWALLLGGLLVSCRKPVVLWRLRYVPWVAGVVLAIEGGYALMHRRLDVGSWPFC